MKWGFAWTLVAILGIGLPGCGGSDSSDENKEKTDKGTTAKSDEPSLDITPESTPDQVVIGLIEAMKSGHKEAKEALLTQKAREETAKHNMPVADTAMPNTEYQVGQPKLLERNPNGAHVSCVLTETLEDGSTQPYEIVWVLRKEPEVGWRIAGMAVELTPGSAPQFLNFEDPLDMERKMEAAAAALAQQEGPATEAGDAQQATATAEVPAGEVETAHAPPPVSKGAKLKKR